MFGQGSKHQFKKILFGAGLPLLLMAGAYIRSGMQRAADVEGRTGGRQDGGIPAARREALREKTAAEAPVRLFVASDMHYLSPALTDRGASFRKTVDNADGKVMDFIEEITEAFTEEVIEAQPDALILAGDLSFNGEAQSHQDFSKKLKRIEEAGVPVLVIPGNHDLGSRSAVCFTGNTYQRVEGMDAAAFRELYGDFGYREALSTVEDSFSYLYPVRKDLRILCLDANANAAIPGKISQKTLAWAESALEMARRDGAEVLSVSHQNLYVHNRLFPYGFSLYGAGALTALLKKQPVICHLSGHMHLQHISRGGDAEGTVEICTSALATYPNQYGILEYDGAEAHYNMKEVDVAGWAERRKAYRDGEYSEEITKEVGVAERKSPMKAMEGASPSDLGTGQETDRKGALAPPEFSAENIDAFLERLGTAEADALALSHFQAFSKAYFERGARQQAAEAMEDLAGDVADLGEKGRQEMLEAFVRLHTAYFSGAPYPLEEISGGIAGWLREEEDPDFTRQYLRSILEDPDRLWLPDQREIRIPVKR